MALLGIDGSSLPSSIRLRPSSSIKETKCINASEWKPLLRRKMNDVQKNLYVLVPDNNPNTQSARPSVNLTTKSFNIITNRQT